MTELLGREARAFLIRQRREQPFFLYLAFGTPHYTLEAPQKYLDRFPASMGRDRKTHLAMVAAVDDVVGNLLDDLARLGIARETVVFYQSDNGATREVRASSYGKPATGGSNGKFRGYKRGLFDGGMHVFGYSASARLCASRCGRKPSHVVDGSPAYISRYGRWTRSAAARYRWTEYPSCATRRAAASRAYVLELQREPGRTARRLETDPDPPQFPGEPVSTGVWLSNLEVDPSKRKNLANAEPGRIRDLIERIRAWERYVEISPAR